MSDKINFEIPRREQKTSNLIPLIVILLIILIITGIVTITLLIVPSLTQEKKSGTPGLSLDEQKELALKLQKRALYDGAIRAWKEYVVQARLTSKERANIWYSIGKLYQEAGNYEEALVSYYTSESINKVKELEQDIGRKISECLEALGKFAALRLELTERVGMDEQKETGSVVVAEIGEEKITKSDLDRKIEQYIELVISQYAAYMDPDALNKQKEELFKQFSGDQGKMKILNQYIIEEILYRKAREEQLADDPKTRALLKAMEKQILAQQLLSKKIAELVKITENDLKTYYEANKGKYIEEGVQKSYEDVRSEVYQELRGQKEQEVQQAFVDELRESYNVVVYPSRLKEQSTGKNESK
ncbi:MAG: hypothetical protein JXB88_18655 [Spirochaetales bacterium]|nr:hypothetical protein [Spirochaetales bacterium]